MVKKQDKLIAVHIPMPIYEELKKVAESRSSIQSANISYVIREAIEKYLDEQKEA